MDLYPSWGPGDYISLPLERSRKLKDREFCSERTAKQVRKPKAIHRLKEKEISTNRNRSKSNYQDGSAFVALLKACAKQKDLLNGSRIHADILKTGVLQSNIYVGSTLVHMYAKCGALAKAKEVFDELPVHNVVSWNALIAGYAQQGYGEEALRCYERMQGAGVCPDTVTFLCILKACGSTAALDKGEELHAEIIRAGLLDKDTHIGNALVDMYAKCGALGKAQAAFDELPVRNVVSWNVLIGGYVEHGHGVEALNCYEQMQHEGLYPNAVTFICILKACGCMGAVDMGEQVHAEIVKEGLLENDILVGTALVDMYATCGALAKAQEVFDELPSRSVVTWNVLITRYTEHGRGEEALECYKQMKLQGLFPNAVTFVCLLKTCASIRAADKGKELHAEIIKQGLLETNILVGTALVEMYAKCGAFPEAQEVFDELPVRDVISWNTLIARYAEHGHGEEALNAYENMQYEGLSPNAVTFLSILKACGSIGAAEKGKEVHAKIIKEGLLEKEVSIGNALVDMYAKCGALAKAQEVFDQLLVRDVVSWNSLIAGYGQFGHYHIVFKLYNKMIRENIQPDLITFIVVLTVCSHSGLLDKGQMYFEAMSRDYGIMPTLEHHVCMVDLFGRAGHFARAVAVLENLQSSYNLTVWHALLGACAKWGNINLGRFAFEHARRLDDKVAAAYVGVSNIYATAGMHKDADNTQAMRLRNEAWNKVVSCG